MADTTSDESQAPDVQKEEKKEEPHSQVQPELESMRSIVLTGYGGYSKLQVQKFAKPKPMQGQVIVRVHAW